MPFTMHSGKMKKKILFIISATLVVALCLPVFYCEITVDGNMYCAPSYPREDISYLLDGRELTEDDYKLIFYQTGLGKRSTDELLGSGKSEIILEYQNDFMSDKNVKCIREVITTCMEYTVNDENIPTAGFMLAPYKKGYVFAMLSSHTLGLRHGHAGLVTDVNRVLEAPMIGVDSREFTANEWRSYPTFVMLRLKDVSDGELAEIAVKAQEDLTGIKYNILAGIINKHGTEIPPTTHCAHLVWYAFYNCGYDIDKNGGRIVSVTDISECDKFEVIQIYGLNPDLYWDRAK